MRKHSRHTSRTTKYTGRTMNFRPNILLCGPKIAAVVLILSVCFGCAKAELSSDEAPGTAGEFCVSKVDCAEPLTCIEQRCCADTGCKQRCESAEEKLEGGSSSLRPSERRRQCMTDCCAARAPIQ